MIQNCKYMEIDKLRNKLHYEESPEWYKFLWSWRFSIKNMGLIAIVKFPYIYYKLWRAVKNAKDNEERNKPSR